MDQLVLHMGWMEEAANTHLAVIALSEKLGAEFLAGTGRGAAAMSPVEG